MKLLDNGSIDSYFGENGKFDFPPRDQGFIANRLLSKVVKTLSEYVKLANKVYNY